MILTFAVFYMLDGHQLPADLRSHFLFLRAQNVELLAFSLGPW